MARRQDAHGAHRHRLRREMDRLEDRDLRQCRQDQPRSVHRTYRGLARRPSDQGLMARYGSKIAAQLRSCVSPMLEATYSASNAASAACAMMTSCSILAPPAATAPTTWPATMMGKPPGTLVKSPMRTAMLNAFSSGA